MSKQSKSITLPCRRYFEDRLIFFIDCKYFAERKLTEEEDKLCDQSIMRAAVELKGFDYALDMLEKEGYQVSVEDRKFSPKDILSSISDMKVTDVVEPVSSESDSGSEDLGGN